MFSHINAFFASIRRYAAFDLTGQSKPPPKPPKPLQYHRVAVNSEIPVQDVRDVKTTHGKSHSQSAVQYPMTSQDSFQPRVNHSLSQRHTMPATNLQQYTNDDSIDRRPTLHPQGPRLPPSNSGFSRRYTANASSSSNVLPYSQAPAVHTYSTYEPRNSTYSNSSFESAHSYNMMHVKKNASPKKAQPFSYMDDLSDPYMHQDKLPNHLITPDSMLTKSSVPPYPDPPVSPLLTREPTSKSRERYSGPISPGASSLSSSGLHSRSTNTQFSSEISDSYEDEAPFRISSGKTPYPDEDVDSIAVRPPYPVTPPPRSPTKTYPPPYPNAFYSDPSQKSSYNQNRAIAANENLVKKEPTIFEHTLRNPRPPLKLLTDAESVNSSDTVTNFPRSQSTVVHEGRLSLPSRSYTVGSRSHSSSGPTIGSNSLRSSSYSTADDSLMLRLDLPAIPDSKVQFDASKLSSKDFEKCETPWLISSLSNWILQYATLRDMTFEELSEALIGLFRHTVPTLGWVAAERVTVPLLESLTSQKFLSVDKDSGLVVIESSISPSGVLPTLIGKGCYSSRTHSYDDTDSSCTNYRCYSSRCWRTLPYKSVLPEMEKALQMDDSDRLNWAKLWGLADEDLGKLDKKVIERQSAIQELIATEETYVRGLKVFLSVYGESLARIRPPIFPQQKKFWNNTFGCIQGLIDCNGAQLLSHLKARQSQQGPFVDSIADLILNWLKVAREPYMNRASTYSFSHRVMVSEKGKNELFSQWLDSVEHDPRVSRQQKFDFLISSPFTRLCKYNLLLGRIKASTLPSNPDYELLDRCMEECKNILNDYNARHGEAEDLSSILTLDEKIQFRSAEEKVDLKLSDARRKIVYESDVLRKGEFGIDFVNSHMILLDHYLIMAKVRKEHMDKYLVSKKVRLYIVQMNPY